MVRVSAEDANKIFKELEDWSRCLVGTSLAPNGP